MYIGIRSAYLNYYDFRRSVGGATNVSRVCFSYFQCILHFATLNDCIFSRQNYAAFTNILRVRINIFKNLRTFHKVLQGRRKYPALKPLKSESDQLAFSSCSLAHPSTSTHHKRTRPVPSPPGGNREEGWKVRAGFGEWERDRKGKEKG